MNTKASGSGYSAGRTTLRAISTLAALIAGLLPVGVAIGQAQTVLIETQVTTAGVPDYEFDSGKNGVYCTTCNFGDGNTRFVFSDQSNNLWLSHIDPATGNFVPPDGRGVLIDTNVAKATDYGNGPEWVESASGSAIVYTKCSPCTPESDEVPTIAIARMVGGVWTVTNLTDAIGRASPDGTKNAADADVYVNYVSDPKGKILLRKFSALGTERELPINSLTDGNSRRWVDGTHKIIFQGHLATDPQLVDQAFLYDVDTDVLEQLTFNPTGVVGAFMWRAPEFNNDLVFLTMAKFRQQILIYRKIPGADRVARWTVIKTIDAPAALPFFFSPEPFVHNGRSYVFTEVSSSSRFFDRTIPNQLAISGINPLQVDSRLLTNDTNVFRLRLDPEVFVTDQGPFIYYNRLVPETAANPAINDGVWRVDTGLGPRTN